VIAERVQRFRVGDRVKCIESSYGLTEPVKGVVTRVTLDPLPEAFAHCAGSSAVYSVSGYDGPVWDWQLEAA
jgi:hypothetical protein